ncbi:MAG: VOC family protein [Chitinophagaceae bacterium]
MKENNSDSLSQSSQLMGAGIGIISTTILVKNLDSALKYYNDVLGFKLPVADTSAIPMYEGTISSYTNFPDWSSLELLAIKDSAIVAQKNSFISSFLHQYEGVRWYTLSTSSADTTMKWLQSRGFKTDTIVSGRNSKKPVKGWQWDDGAAQWHDISFNHKFPPAQFPDFIEFAGTSLYEYKDEWRPYAGRKYYDSLNNGVVAMSSLQIVVNDINAARIEFKKMGFQEMQSSDSSVRFKIAHDQYLHLTGSGSPESDAAKFLKLRGEGVFAIGFEVKNLQNTYDFLKKKLNSKALVMDSAAKKLSVLKEYALGVQLQFVQESKQNSAMAAIYNYKDDKKLDSVSAKYTQNLYLKYCALCHGNNREGYAADNAPSLKSKALLAVTQTPRSAYNYLVHTISYGRTGTAMAPYSKSQGGPLDIDQIDLIIKWLYDESGVKKTC